MKSVMKNERFDPNDFLTSQKSVMQDTSLIEKNLSINRPIGP